MNNKSIALVLALALSGVCPVLWLYVLSHMKEEHKRNGSWTLPAIATWWPFNEHLFDDRCRKACQYDKVLMVLTASAYIYWFVV